MPIKKYYQSNKQYYKDYNRNYLKQWRLTTTKKYKYERDNAKDAKKFRAKFVNYYEEYYKPQYLDKSPLNRKKSRVRAILNNAIKKGVILRQFCSIKNCTVIGEAHHNDYDKPLVVEWLCRKHHKQLHLSS